MFSLSLRLSSTEGLLYLSNHEREEICDTLIYNFATNKGDTC